MSEALHLTLLLPTKTPPLQQCRSRVICVFSSTSSPGLQMALLQNKFVGVGASTSSSWSVEEWKPPPEKDGAGQYVGAEEAPTSIKLETVSGEEQFDMVISEAQQLGVPVIVVWMANWCRKCIYLKPKLEKLAADYYGRIGFYHVDVNAVPHKLVKRAGVAKMPTIQLWKDSTKQAEVIGGHKAWLVIEDICRMIEDIP